jgi:O-antigen/teichoic acid export membrane protein
MMRSGGSCCAVVVVVFVGVCVFDGVLFPFGSVSEWAIRLVFCSVSGWCWSMIWRWPFRRRLPGSTPIFDSEELIQ